MAYGSPDRIEDVPAYYADIRGGRPIAPERLDDLVARYRRLGIEDSNPLNEITERTRAALEAELGVPVFTGMKHWTPRIADAAEAALATGAATIVGLVLAPHYSRLSIGGYRRQLEEALAGRAELAFVESWGTEPGFVDLLADRVRGTAAHVVFTAHSLPARILDEGDPYERQLMDSRNSYRCSAQRSERLVASATSPSRRPASPGSGPTSSTTSPTCTSRGVTDVLLCPIGFVADHLEIRWDLDIEARDKARELGLSLERIEMPNDDPAFVATLATIVHRALAVPSTA